MTSREIAEYMAYDQLDPFGAERFDLLAGIVASTIANAMQNGKNRKTFKPKDFMPDWEAAQKPAQTVDEQIKMVEFLNALFGGKDLRETQQ